jgi:hypothetical protein
VQPSAKLHRETVMMHGEYLLVAAVVGISGCDCFA